MSTETILEKDSMVDELDKDFNTTVLKMLKDLRKRQKKLKTVGTFEKYLTLK